MAGISTVEPIEYAIKYDTISKSIEKGKVYDGGWYFIGLTSEFRTFPATLINMDFTKYPGANRGPIRLKDAGGQ